MRYALALLVMTCPALADVIAPDGRVIECYCTDSRGDRVDMGGIICLTVNGRSFTAQCQMSLNVPMWREIAQGCLSSRLDPGADILQPALDAGPVHPQV